MMSLYLQYNTIRYEYNIISVFSAQNQFTFSSATFHSVTRQLLCRMIAPIILAKATKVVAEVKGLYPEIYLSNHFCHAYCL